MRWTRTSNIPSQYRWNLGIKHTLPWDIEWNADIICHGVKDEVLWQDIRLVQTGTAPDGRPLYATRADVSCRFQCLPRPPASGHRARISCSPIPTRAKGRYSRSMFRRPGALAQGASTPTSATATRTSRTSTRARVRRRRSNWDNFAVSDPNDPGLETSNYEIEHQFKGLFAWRKAFFGDYETSVALVANAARAVPYSYTFGAGTLGILGRSAPVESPARSFSTCREQGTGGDVIYEAQCSATDVTNLVAGCASTSSFTSANAAAAQFALGHGRLHRAPRPRAATAAGSCRAIRSAAPG